MANLKLKSKLQAQQGILLPLETAERALLIDNTGEIKSSTVTSTELGHLSGVTSAVQTQLNDKASIALDNLASVAINTDLLPDTNNTRKLGSETLAFNGLYTDGNIIAPTAAQFQIFSLVGDFVAYGETRAEFSSNADVFLESFGGDVNIATVNGGSQITINPQTHVSLSSKQIKDLANHTLDQDAATKKYVDDEIAALPAPFFYAGNYDASLNSPDLDQAGTRISGAVYRVSVAGTHDFGAFGGSITFQVGDKVVYNGVNSVWEKWDVTDNENTDQITEGTTNLYFTDERAQDAVGTILQSSVTVDLVYDDLNNQIEANVITDNSIVSTASGIALDGDALAPGNDKYYGTNGAGLKGFYDLPTGGSANDILETSFSIANNVSTPTNVTGFLLNSQVRSFKALVSVEIDATLDLFESFELLGVQKAGVFEMAQQSVGDEAGVVFTITSGGQLQYTSADYAGFVSGTIRFRAITTSF